MSKELGRSVEPRIVAGSHQGNQLPVPERLQECSRPIAYEVWPGSPHNENWYGDRAEIRQARAVAEAGIHASPGGGTTLTQPPGKSAIQIEGVAHAASRIPCRLGKEARFHRVLSRSHPRFYGRMIRSASGFERVPALPYPLTK